MKNKYDGKCIFCACNVPKKQGVCWKHEIKGWIVSCNKCARIGSNLSKRLDNLNS